MCLNEPISWITLILGTILNIISIGILSRMVGKTIPILLIVAWQYALLMQIPDALAWRNPKNQMAGKMAFGLNVTQPLVFMILIWAMNTKNAIGLLPAVGVGIIYFGFVLNYVITGGNYNVFTKKEKCPHLNYGWWERIPSMLYMATMILTCLAIPSLEYKLLSIFIFLVSAYITALFTPKQCILGSLWCWSVASAGFITFLCAILL